MGDMLSSFSSGMPLGLLAPSSAERYAQRIFCSWIDALFVRSTCAHCLVSGVVAM